jgi:hypothetical protein
MLYLELDSPVLFISRNEAEYSRKGVVTMKLAAIAVIATLVLPLMGQSESPKIVFHVTSVEQGEATDWCTTGKCSATRFTVRGYAVDIEDRTPIEYVLDCVETIANEPKPHVTAQCPRVHAHKDYDAELGADSIFFADSPSDSSGRPSTDKPIVMGYTIKSEKEVQRTDSSKPRPKK